MILPTKVALATENSLLYSFRRGSSDLNIAHGTSESMPLYRRKTLSAVLIVFSANLMGASALVAVCVQSEILMEAAEMPTCFHTIHLPSDNTRFSAIAGSVGIESCSSMNLA